MIWSFAAPSATREQTSPRLVEFVESYVCWREAAFAAQEAYEHWTGVEPEGRAPAFAVYQAALDGEEVAARAHRARTERIAGGALDPALVGVA